MITIPKKEYEQLRKKSQIADQLGELDIDFVRQITRSKEDLRHGRFKRLA